MAGLLFGPRRALLSIDEKYYRKFLGYNPIAYWPLWEPSGGVAFDLSGNGFNGSYSGATLGQPGIGDGKTCPLLGGDGDHVDVYTAGFRDAWNGAELTVAGWFKVFNVGEWTSDEAVVFNLQADANNFVTGKIHDTDNQFSFAYKAGGTAEWVNVGGLSYTDWVHFAITVSKSTGADGEVKGYLNGSQVGGTQTSLGVWAGNLVANSTLIGATGTGGANPWYGWVAHVGVFDSAKTPAQISDMAVV